MIEKSRTIPLYLQKLQALDRRLPAFHPKRAEVENELARWRAGFKGEQSIDYHLGFLNEDWRILHNLRLHDGTRSFQIDTLLLTTSCIILVEVKNITGILTLDAEFHQLIRFDNEKEEAFQHPVHQADRHKMQMGWWLERNHIPSLPIKTLVVMAHPRSVLKRKNGTAGMYPQVIPAYLLPDKIHELHRHYPDPVLSDADVRELIRLLLAAHSESPQNPLHRHHIPSSDLVKGVFCPACGKTVMERIHGNWLCPHCGCTSKKAHHQALQDYAFLIHPRISNQEAASFLHISSPSTMKRLLRSLSYPASGSGRAVKYKILLD
ncbi:nuclease-related domain-containing protein [Salibacterium qingdaonense]|uniref:nuclease-related domain-containing protein n=1 Tax=Salibacterium qingdaonense TaxID=266892 RepID=UPI0015A66DA2|nr:nuclease-related domain-containing protein [Salibacterium qingdaonense]